MGHRPPYRFATGGRTKCDRKTAEGRRETKKGRKTEENRPTYTENRLVRRDALGLHGAIRVKDRKSAARNAAKRPRIQTTGRRKGETDRDIAQNHEKTRKGPIRKTQNPPTCSRSKIPISISESDPETTNLVTQRTMTRDLRNCATRRGRLGDFDRGDFGRAADIFPHDGYYRAETLRRAQEHTRAFSISILRKNNTKTTHLGSARLALESIETFRTKMNSKGPVSKMSKYPEKWPAGNPRCPPWPER